MRHGVAVMVSYYFPPLVGIASERAAAFARHLPDVGWTPIIVAPRKGYYHRADEQLTADTTVVRTRNPELSRLLRSGFDAATGAAPSPDGAVAPTEPSRTTARLRRFVRDVLYVPDAQMGWIPFAAQAVARELSRVPGPSILFSSSVPYSAHFAAMYARRRWRMPWVAEFRDPWSEAHPLLRPSSPRRQRLDRRMHRSIVNSATHIVVTSDPLRARLLAAFPQLDPQRVDVVMNGFEPGPAGVPPSPAEPLRILYAGTVAPGENVVPVLQAMELLHQRKPGRIRLAIVGPTAPWNTDIARPWLETSGLHTPEQARSLMRNASALFLLQSNEAYMDTIPGKLLEYVGARRPILAAVPESWPMVALMRAHADARVTANAVVGLVRMMEEVLVEHESGRLQAPRVSEEVTRPFERREQTRRLAAVFQRALESKR
jgi:glycosyltransferase involved in cell wall biosynthesis